MLEAPLRMSACEVLEKVQYYCNAFNAKLFSAPFLKCRAQCLAPPRPSHSSQASMQTVTSRSSPTAAKTTVKKRKRANQAERRKAQTPLTVEQYDILVELLSPADASKRPSFASIAREWKNQCQLECSNDWLRDKVRTRWEAMNGVGAARRAIPRAMRARLDPGLPALLSPSQQEQWVSSLFPVPIPGHDQTAHYGVGSKDVLWSLTRAFRGPDGAYSGTFRLAAPYRKPKGRPPLARKDRYNEIHAYFRARVEYIFTCIWSFAIVHQVWRGKGLEGACELHLRILVLFHFINFQLSRKIMYEPTGVWSHTPEGGPAAEEVECETLEGFIADDCPDEGGEAESEDDVGPTRCQDSASDEGGGLLSTSLREWLRQSKDRSSSSDHLNVWQPRLTRSELSYSCLY